MTDLFLPTSQTGLLGCFTLLCVVGFFVGLAITFRSSGGHLLVGCSAAGLICAGPSFLMLILFDAQQSLLNERKVALTPVYERQFDKSCTPSGVVLDGAHDMTCYDFDIYRVWSVGDRYYIGVVNGGRPEIAVIFDRGGMIGNRSDSVIFISPDVDLHRINQALVRTS